jgi:steroid 5-alpha reductase family enzyme
MSKSGATLLMVVAYALVAVAGVGVLQTVELPPLWLMFLADLLGTAIIFGFSLATKNSSMYDPYWSVAPLMIGAWWWMEAGFSASGGLVMAALLVWGGRLTWNFLRGWPGLHHEDWRYVDLRMKSGRAYWLVSLTGIHLFPTLLVFGGMLPAYVALSGPPTQLWLAVLGLLVCLSAAVIQGIADNQLRSFRASAPPSGSILEAGLWRYSRHPNYFGEVLFWWGIALLGLATDPTAIWALIGPVGITGLFVFISVPMTDNKTLQSRPHYAAHMLKVSGLIPLPRRE